MELTNISYSTNSNQLITGVLSVVPQWVKVTKTYSDFSTAGLTNDVEIYSLPAKGIVHSVIVKHSVSFAGGIIATYTASAGITGTLAKYAIALDVNQAVSATAFQLGVAIVPAMESFTTAVSVRGAVISTVGLLNAATSGSVDFYLLLSKLP